MTKKTVLEITQIVLNKLNSDEVNSINDTTESMQVAMEVEATYHDIMANIEWPFQDNLIQLEGSVDLTRPTHMTIDGQIDHISWIKYNNGTAISPDYRDVCYLCPEDFLFKVLTDTNDGGLLTVQDFSGAYLVVKTNKQPSYWTTFDDVHVVFDSYMSDVDDTLQTSKVICFGQTIPEFTLEDDFIPALPVKLFPMLIAEVAAACFIYWKQTASSTDERRARRGMVRSLNNRARINTDTQKVPNFGR